jgi:hypothetical protein
VRTLVALLVWIAVVAIIAAFVLSRELERGSAMTWMMWLAVLGIGTFVVIGGAAFIYLLLLAKGFER